MSYDEDSDAKDVESTSGQGDETLMAAADLRPTISPCPTINPCHPDQEIGLA